MMLVHFVGKWWGIDASGNYCTTAKVGAYLVGGSSQTNFIMSLK